MKKSDPNKLTTQPLKFIAVPSPVVYSTAGGKKTLTATNGLGTIRDTGDPGVITFSALGREVLRLEKDTAYIYGVPVSDKDDIYSAIVEWLDSSKWERK